MEAGKHPTKENTSITDSGQSEAQERPQDSSNLRALQPSSTAPVVLQAIDNRIAHAPLEDLVELVRIREDLVNQNKEIEERAHARNIEKMQLIFKMVLSTIAVAGGVGLVLLEYTFPGFFVLGAGLYSIAPDFVTVITDKVLEEDK